MKENFLHFVWQHQYFDKKELYSDTGEAIQIFATGVYNTNAGPDFLNTKIKVGDVTWYGNVEIHIHASDWLAHQHEKDQAYDNVILHVVWKNDKQLKRKDGTVIPCIELKDRINAALFSKYSSLVVSSQSLPCASHLSKTPDILKISMVEKALMNRLEKKANAVLEMLDKNTVDWEETSYRLLCKNFGFKLNAEPFSRLALVLPYKLIKKHKNNQLQVEALLFGQAGMLNRNFQDQYCKELKKEYEFLSHKYGLSEQVDQSEWKFLRLRPANFPSFRIAQLAAILTDVESLFTTLTEPNSPDDIIKFLQKKTSLYWTDHYSLEKKSKVKSNGVGLDSIQNIIINTIVPLIAAAGKAKDREDLLDKAFFFLESLPPENNRITRMWKDAGLIIKTAADAQGSIELFNSFCSNKLCLNCNIGVAVVKDQ